LEAAINAAGLDVALDNEDGTFTVFAPTDAAFAALPAGTIEALLADPQGALTQILLYHVASEEIQSFDLTNGQFITTLNGKSVSVKVNDNGIFINNAKVTVADIYTDNGIVHVIDAVLLPPNTVADILANSPVHSTLVTAATAAGLIPALEGAGSLTVFAPTDDAFAALPAGTIEALLADPQGALAQILLYHVVGTRALSTDLSNGQTIKTLNGKDVNVTINNNGVLINNAKVTVADLIADNGVVHVIDAVLLPPSATDDFANEIELNIYPIPSTGNIIVKSISDIELEATILDMKGRIQEIKTGTNTIKLDFNMNPGSYLLNIKNKTGKMTSKVIVKI
jgi:uncharacterized surface protein with fasciclin (FAS1) repeats